MRYDAVPAGARRWQITAVVVPLAAVAVGVALVLATLVAPRPPAPGLPSAGGLPATALPAMTALVAVLAAVTVGWLIGAAILAPPQRSGTPESGTVDVGGYRCLRAASTAAMAWAIAGLVLLPVSAATRLGEPITSVLGADSITRASRDEPLITATLIGVGIAVVVAVGARVVMRAGSARALLALALAAVVITAFAAGSGSRTGTGASDNHDFAMTGLMFHLLGVAVWLGALIALIGLTRQRAPHLDLIARRYSALATTAIVTVAASVLVLALVRLPTWRDLVTTDYGRLVIAQAALILALAVIGYIRRHRLLARLAENGPHRSLIRLAVAEAAILAGTIGIGATLAHTAVPPLPGVVPSAAGRVLGFEFPGPPGIGTFLLWWRPDLIFATLAVAGAASYLFGVRRLRRRGETWPGLRTLAWLIGCAVLLWATSSGMGLYARAQFSAAVIEHMILVMIVPVFLVLGGPVTLLTRLWPRAQPGETPGLREAIDGMLASRPACWLTHPLPVVAVFVASFLIWYFTGAFSLVMTSYPGQVVGELYFLALGYWYYSAIIGIDPWPRARSFGVRFVMVVVPLPFYAFIGLMMLSSHDVIAAGYFGELALPWVGDLLADQHVGGGLGWGLTEGPLAIVMIVLAAQWARSDERRAKQRDREADAHDDPDLVAYNQMLAAMADRDER